MPTLQRCVGDTSHFERLHWGRAPALIRRADIDPADLLTIDDVDTIINSAARWPALRVVVDGVNRPPTDYCTPIRIGSRTLEHVADPVKLLDQYRRGATLVLHSLHRTWPAISRFTTDLEAEISHTVQANAYLTPPGSAGLAPHADRHDVLVVQLHGIKEWWVDGLDTFVVHRGGVLYLPRGTRHRARTTTSPSLHLTIGIHPTTHSSIVRRALAQLEDELSSPLPLGFRDLDAASLARHVGSALAEAAAGLSSIEPSALVDRLHVPRPRRDRSGDFAAAVRRDAVRPSTSIRLTHPPRQHWPPALANVSGSSHRWACWRRHRARVRHSNNW